MTQRNGKTFCAHGLEEWILLKCLYCPKQYTQFNAIPIKISRGFFTQLVQKNPEIYMEPQKKKPSNSQSNFEKEKWSWSFYNSRLQVILQSYSNKNSMVLEQK